MISRPITGRLRTPLFPALYAVIILSWRSPVGSRMRRCFLHAHQLMHINATAGPRDVYMNSNSLIMHVFLLTVRRGFSFQDPNRQHKDLASYSRP